jgi:cell wall-associated NlpC family hydrolase
MPGRLPVRRALVAGLSILVLAPAAAALGASAAELAAARAQIDRTSAELAQARTAAERLGGEERDELERLERRLQRQKDGLLALEAGIEERHAAEQAEAARDARAADAPAPQAPPGGRGDDGPVVVLGDSPREAAPAPATVSATGVVTLPDERRPAVSGDDAAVAAGIDGYLAGRASPLTGLGAVFVTEARAVGLDPLFLVAIAGAETSFGTYGPSQAIHNPFGMGPHIVYGSWSESIRAAARNLGGDLYLGSGLTTVPAIQARWAPNGAGNDPTGLNSNWTRNVSTYLAELGGDPAAAVFTTLPAAPPAPAGDPPAAPGPAGAPVVTPVVPVVAAPVTLGASGRGAAAAEAALGRLGVGGERGGDTPATGFDASGLVAWAYREQGVALPRSAVAQSRVGAPVEPTDLEAGDAVFFSDPSGLVVGVGLYLGDGQFVHAPGPGEPVTIASLYEPHHAESYAGARRY